VIELRRMILEGHAVVMREMRNVYKILIGYPAKRSSC
jgi:hypothetical protein